MTIVLNKAHTYNIPVGPIMAPIVLFLSILSWLKILVMVCRYAYSKSKECEVVIHD